MKLIPLLSLRTLRTAPLDLKFIHKSMKLFSQSSNSKGKIVKKKFNSFPFQYQEEVIVKITNITNLGSGVGRKELSDGSQWVIHVPYTIPNEEVKCRVFRNHASYSEADLVEVLQPSPTRVEPVCKFYSQCGGCQYQVNICFMIQIKI